jgi:hypothetical protein
MSDDDEPLRRLLHSLAPADRDPLFRIKVLERREHRQFVGRVVVVLAAAVASGVAYATAAMLAGTHEVARGIAFSVAGVMAAAIFLPALLRLIRAMGR